MATTKQVRSKPPAAGKGRRKGSVNKTTALLKDAILMAAEGAGGKGGIVAYLQEQAILNPGPFLTLLGKVLPTQIAGEDGGAVKHEMKISWMTPDEAKQRGWA